MRVALFSDGIYPFSMGGMQKHSYYLAKYLAKAGIKVDVYHAVPEGKSTPTMPTEFFTAEELKHLCFHALPFPKNHRFPGHYLWESYNYSKRVYREYLKQKPTDFVYIQGFSGWKFLRQKTKDKRHRRQETEDRRQETEDRRQETGIRNSVLTGINFHGLNMYQKAANLKSRFEQLLFRPFVKYNLIHSDIIFSLGGVLSTIQKKKSPRNQIIEIPIGINKDWIIEPLERKASQKIQFTFIGRYERLKGIEELNSVITNLLVSHADSFTCHFIGPIPEKKQLHNHPSIVYYGAIREELKIKSILSESDVLLCPSWSEGMPTVILEAMASGCAIIASDLGAVSEQVNSKNGILIEPGNEVALQHAMVTMLSLPTDKLLAMKQASVERIKSKFLWDTIIKKTIMEIDALVKNNVSS